MTTNGKPAGAADGVNGLNLDVLVPSTHYEEADDDDVLLGGDDQQYGGIAMRANSNGSEGRYSHSEEEGGTGKHGRPHSSLSATSMDR